MHPPATALRPISHSHARTRALLTAAGIALAWIALHALASAQLLGALEYNAQRLHAEPWRLLSAHWVHTNWPHALVNGLAWVAVVWLWAEQLTAPRQLLIALIAALAVSLALMAWPNIDRYRGASGLVHTLFFMGASMRLLHAWPDARARRLPLAWLIAGSVKVLLESPWSAHTPWAPWLGAPVAAQVHGVGALIGVGLAWLLVRFNRAEFNRAGHAARGDAWPPSSPSP